MNIEQLEKTSLAQAATKITEAAHRAAVSYLETAVLRSVAKRKLEADPRAQRETADWLNAQPSGRNDWKPEQITEAHYLRMRGVKESTLENSKPAMFVYDELVRSGEITADAFENLTHKKCCAIYNSMGGKSRGGKVENVLSAETVAAMIETVAEESLADELTTMAEHGCTVAEYAEKKKAESEARAAAQAQAKAGKTATAPATTAPAPTKQQPKDYDPTGDYVVEIRALTGRVEANPPKDPAAVAAALEDLLAALKAAQVVTPIKPKTKTASKKTA